MATALELSNIARGCMVLNNLKLGANFYGYIMDLYLFRCRGNVTSVTKNSYFYCVTGNIFINNIEAKSKKVQWVMIT